MITRKPSQLNSEPAVTQCTKFGSNVRHPGVKLESICRWMHQWQLQRYCKGRSYWYYLWRDSWLHNMYMYVYTYTPKRSRCHTHCQQRTLIYEIEFFRFLRYHIFVYKSTSKTTLTFYWALLVGRQHHLPAHDPPTSGGTLWHSWQAARVGRIAQRRHGRVGLSRAAHIQTLPLRHEGLARASRPLVTNSFLQRPQKLNQYIFSTSTCILVFVLIRNNTCSYLNEKSPEV